MGSPAVPAAVGLAGLYQSENQHCFVAEHRVGDLRCTPGERRADVSQANIKGTICDSAWDGWRRPPYSYTSPLKTELIGAYGLHGGNSAYELDHLIPLELGGDQDSVKNLWPEPYESEPGARQKDVVETYLKHRVCDNEMTLAAAQQIVLTRWEDYLPGGAGRRGSVHQNALSMGAHQIQRRSDDLAPSVGPAAQRTSSVHYSSNESRAIQIKVATLNVVRGRITGLSIA